MNNSIKEKENNLDIDIIHYEDYDKYYKKFNKEGIRKGIVYYNTFIIFYKELNFVPDVIKEIIIEYCLFIPIEKYKLECKKKLISNEEKEQLINNLKKSINECPITGSSSLKDSTKLFSRGRTGYFTITMKVPIKVKYNITHCKNKKNYFITIHICKTIKNKLNCFHKFNFIFFKEYCRFEM